MKNFIIILILFLCACDTPIICDDETACNKGDEGNCLYNDCNDICGGLSNYDECNICNGPGYFQCWNGVFVCDLSECLPFIEVEEYFDHYQSNSYAFYFFDEVLINNQQIDNTDWVAAFNGDICVGAKKWDCTSSTCELPIYGYNSLNSLTNGYMLSGELPLFKIYDASDSIYYDAIPSSSIPWQDGDFFNQIGTLIAQ